MKDDAPKIETDSLLNMQQLTNNETEMTVNNDSNNAQWRHSLEQQQIKRLHSASTVTSLDTTRTAAQLDKTRLHHNWLEIKL
jgi:hypothetical protein